MLKLSLNQPSVEAIREWAGFIPAAVENIREATARLLRVYQSMEETLGVHRAVFCSILQEVACVQELAAEAVEVLPKKLYETADRMEVYLNGKEKAVVPETDNANAVERSKISAVASKWAVSAKTMSCFPGEYHYESSGKNTRHVYGQLKLAEKDELHRNLTAQRSAGEGRRRGDDDGGHLIGARFGGAATSENLFPQNRNLNRGEYKALENEWASLLQNDARVYVNIYTSASSAQMREDTIYGTYTVIQPSGRSYTEAFSFCNESGKTQAGWEALVNER